MPELAVKRTPGRPVGAVGFLPAGGYFETKRQLGFDAQQDLALSVWLQVREKPSGRWYPVTKGSGEGRFWLTVDNVGKVSANIYFGAGKDHYLTAGPDIVDAAWHHVAVNVDRDGLMELYVDNVRVGTRDVSDAAADAWVDALFTVGRLSAGNGFRGALDRLRIWRGRLLTAADVAALHGGREPAGATGLVLACDFDHPRWHRPSAEDRSGGDAHLIAFGAGLIQRVPRPTGFPSPDRLGLDLTFADWPHDRDLASEWVGRVFVPTPSTGATVRVTKDPATGKSVLVCQSGTGSDRNAFVGSSTNPVVADVRGAASIRLRARLAVTGIVQGAQVWHRASVQDRLTPTPAWKETGSPNFIELTSEIPTGTVAAAEYSDTKASAPRKFGFYGSHVLGNNLCQGKSEWEYVRVEPTLRAPVAGRTVRKR